MTGYAAVDQAARAAEAAEGGHGRRIVKVFSDDARLPELWIGTFGSAPIEAGPSGYVFSDGEAVTL